MDEGDGVVDSCVLHQEIRVLMLGMCGLNGCAEVPCWSYCMCGRIVRAGAPGVYVCV